MIEEGCAEMRLHYYTPAVSNSYCVGVHNGHGLGSLFAKLFSRIAAKSSSRPMLKAVQGIVGRKELSRRVNQVSGMAKRVAKDSIRSGAKLGAKAIGSKIRSLENAMINKGDTPDIVHNLSDVLVKGSREGINKLGISARKRAGIFIDKASERVKRVGAIPKKRKRKSTSKFAQKLSKRIKKVDKPTYDLQRIIDSA